MFLTSLARVLVAGSIFKNVLAHSSIFHESMWGFNATTDSPFYGAGVPGETDNRPVVPLINRTFEQWWFHGYYNYPPHPGDIMQLPSGGDRMIETACGKEVTSYYRMTGTVNDLRTDSTPCPGKSSDVYHTKGLSTLGGCALAIAYQSDASQVKPEDFTVFSVNQTCVYERETHFQIPKDMPPCPNGKCTCAWFWIHAPLQGSQQMYMIPFQCNIAGATGTQPVAKGNLARRCGDDPALNRSADPSNCTQGAKTPMYWFQAEQNTFFEDMYHPPQYNDLYGWSDGAQQDIFRSVPWTNTSDPSSTTISPTSTTLSASVATSTSPISSTTTSINVPTSTSPATSSPFPTQISPGDQSFQRICLRPKAKPLSSSGKIVQFVSDAIGLGRTRHYSLITTHPPVFKLFQSIIVLSCQSICEGVRCCRTLCPSM